MQQSNNKPSQQQIPKFAVIDARAGGYEYCYSIGLQNLLAS